MVRKISAIEKPIKKKDSTRACWNEIKKGYFVKLLCDCNTSKYRAQNGWNKETWNKILYDMNEKYPLDNFHVKQIKDLEQDLKKQYKLVKYLTELSGFGWDYENNMVKAPDEVWQPIFERLPNAKKWYKQPFPYFVALHDLYNVENRSRAGGVSSSRERSTSPLPQSPMPSIPAPGDFFGEWEETIGEHNLNEPDLFCSQVPEHIQETQHVVEPTPRSQAEVNPSIRRPSSSRASQSKANPSMRQPSSSQASKKSKSCFQDEYLEFHREEADRFFVAMERQRIQPSEEYSITKCINVFNEMEGFDNGDLFQAIEIFNVKNNREVFLALKEE